MIRTESEYKLAAATEALQKHLDELQEELATLDPSGAYKAVMMCAAAQGVVLYMGNSDAV